MTDIRTILRDTCVGIAGAGGLGSNCAAALVRAGAGKIIVADHDVVSASNLRRQFFFIDQVGMKKVVALKRNLLRIDPAVDVEIHDIRLDENSVSRLYKPCDVVVEALDSAPMKVMFVQAAWNLPRRPAIVSGTGIAGWGRNDQLRTERYHRLIICGDLQSEESDDNPVMAPKVGIVAAMQANLVLELLMDANRRKLVNGECFQCC